MPESIKTHPAPVRRDDDAGPAENSGEDDFRRAERGLDRLDTDDWRSGTRAVRIRRMAWAAVQPLITLLVLLVAWQLIYLSGWQPPSVVPSPRMVAGTFADLWREGAVIDALWVSGSRAAFGFGLSLLIGTLLGLLLARVRLLRAAIGPYLTALSSMPAVAWVPAAIVAFGFTDSAIYSVVIAGAVPSVANGLVAGVATVPPLLLRAGHVLGARGWAAFRYVVIPAALPGYLAGVRQAWAFAWRSLMAAELIAYSPELGVGVGQMLEQGRSLFDMPRVVVAMLLVLAVGLAVELCVLGPIERRVLRRRGMGAATDRAVSERGAPGPGR